MASHHQPGTVIPLHRGIADQPRDYPARPVDLCDQLLEHQGIRRGLLDRIGDALSGDRFFFWFLGFAAGLAIAAVFAAAWTLSPNDIPISGVE